MKDVLPTSDLETLDLDGDGWLDRPLNEEQLERWRAIQEQKREKVALEFQLPPLHPVDRKH